MLLSLMGSEGRIPYYSVLGMMLLFVSQFWHEHMAAVLMPGRKRFFSGPMVLGVNGHKNEEPTGGIESKLWGGRNSKFSKTFLILEKCFASKLTGGSK